MPRSQGEAGHRFACPVWRVADVAACTTERVLAQLISFRPLLQRIDKQVQVTAALPIVGEGHCNPGTASGVNVSAFVCLGESNFDDLTPSPEAART